MNWKLTGEFESKMFDAKKSKEWGLKSVTFLIGGSTISRGFVCMSEERKLRVIPEDSSADEPVERETSETHRKEWEVGSRATDRKVRLTLDWSGQLSNGTALKSLSSILNTSEISNQVRNILRLFTPLSVLVHFYATQPFKFSRLFKTKQKQT